MTDGYEELFAFAAKLGLTGDEIQDSLRLTEMADEAVVAKPIPRRWHRCRMVFGHGDFSKPGDHVEWCACGGIRRNGGRWMQRNSRRKHGV